MKQKIFYSFLGIAVYLLVGAFFYGYHTYMLGGFLLLLGVVGYFISKNRTQEQVRSNLFYLAFPALLLLVVTSIVTDNFKLGAMYLIGGFFTIFITYYMVKNKNTPYKYIFPFVLLLWVGISSVSASYLLEGEQEKTNVLKAFCIWK